MKLKFILQIACCVCIMSGCNGGKQGVVMLNLDDPQEKKTLNFSDLAQNIRIVPIECSDSVVINDRGTNFLVSEQHIVALGQDVIRLFSPEGKFVRNLAVAGNGPEEYKNIASSTIDDKNGILYFSHYSDREHIQAIDLKSGSRLPQIKTFGMPRTIQLNGDRIVYSPSDDNISFNLYAVNRAGETTDSIFRSDGVRNMFMRGLIKGCGKNVYFDQNDTIYEVSFPGCKPMAVVQYENKFDDRTNPKGTGTSYIQETPSYILMQKLDIEMERSENAVGIRSISTAIFLLDKTNWELTAIDKFNVDMMGIKLLKYPNIVVCDNKISMAVSAFKIKELVESMRTKGETISPELQELDLQLTEDSNPVLVVGDVK